MSNRKPHIYAYCDAGSKWEVPHKTDVPFKETISLITGSLSEDSVHVATIGTPRDQLAGARLLFTFEIGGEQYTVFRNVDANLVLVPVAYVYTTVSASECECSYVTIGVSLVVNSNKTNVEMYVFENPKSTTVKLLELAVVELGSPLFTMTGATAIASGKAGAVPVPDAGDQDKVLHGDGTWRNAETIITETPVSVVAPTAVNLTASRIFYYVSSDMENISVTYDSLPNGWVGFLTIYNISGASFSSDVMATKSINGVAQSAVGNISGCINIVLFKYGGSNKLQWFLFKS